MTLAASLRHPASPTSTPSDQAFRARAGHQRAWTHAPHRTTSASPQLTPPKRPHRLPTNCGTRVRVAGSNPVVRSTRNPSLAGVSSVRAEITGLRVAHHAHHLAHHLSGRGVVVGRSASMQGSLRQRGAASWELRVYAGTDPESRKRRYRTATVTGNRSDAERGLARLVAEVHSDKAIGSASTVSELLEAWFAIASTSWAPTTTRETRSILDRCLHPHLGALRVGEVTPAVIDATYAGLRERGGMKVVRSNRGRCRGSTSCSDRHSPRPSVGAGCGTTPLSGRTGSWYRRPRCNLRHLPNCSSCSITSDSATGPSTRSVLLAATTGARRAQLLGLKWEQVHRDTMRVDFCRGWVDGHNGPTVAPTKTRRRHSVDISTLTFDAVGVARRRTGDRVRVQRRRGSDRVEAEPGHQDLHSLSPCRGLPGVPVPRPATLHGDRDAARRHPTPDRRPPARSPTPLDDTELLRPGRPRRRRPRGRDTRSAPRNDTHQRRRLSNLGQTRPKRPFPPSPADWRVRHRR